jgi:hypothetical protein
MSLEGVEHLLNIRLMLKKINPTKERVVIYKTHIILVPPKEARAGPQTSE